MSTTPSPRCTMLDAIEGGTVATHRGAPCEDPECPFRRPIRHKAMIFSSEFADRLRAQAQTAAVLLRTRLGIEAKAAHVRGEAAKPADRPHFCHVPGCHTPTPPAYLMCGAHWKLVPFRIKRTVWETYEPGQEHGEAEVSPAYLEAANAAIAAVLEAMKPKAEVAPAETPQMSLFGEESNQHARRK